MGMGMEMESDSYLTQAFIMKSVLVGTVAQRSNRCIGKASETHRNHAKIGLQHPQYAENKAAMIRRLTWKLFIEEFENMSRLHRIPRTNPYNR